MRRSFSQNYALPDEVKGMLARRLNELLGIVLIGVAALAGLALATWSVQDPSFNHAGATGPVRNWLGFGGAAAADFLMQIFGVASIAILTPAAFWGWRLLAHKSVDAQRMRLICLGSGILLAAGFASGFPVTMHWPLPTGLGGVAGDWAFGIPAFMLFVHHSPIGQGLLTVMLGIGAFLTLAVASGFFFHSREIERPAPDMPMRMRGEPRRPRDEDEDDERSVPLLGAVMHWALSLKHTLLRKRVKPGPERYGQAGDRPGGISDLLARVKTAAHLVARPGEAQASRREPAFTPRTAPRPDARRPNEAISLDGEEDLGRVPSAPYGGIPADDDYDDEEAPAPPPRARPTRPLVSMAEAAARDIDPPRATARVVPPPTPPKQGRRIVRESEPDFPFEHRYELPPLALLAEPRRTVGATVSQDALEQNARLLEGVLEDFGVRGEIINVRPGPVVTLYELEPAPGIKSSRVIGLADDIARSMSAISARVAVVPGRNVIGIELPNAKRETVYFREMIGSEDFEKSKFKLTMALGKNIGGEPVMVQLEKMPHLLVAGTTGSGKSVAINTMILSLLYRLKPEECRMIMVDPKMLELSVYDGIPHLLSPVVTDMKKVVLALKWAVREMEERYKKMAKLGVRNIDGFNQRAAEAKAKGDKVLRTVQTGFDKETGQALYEQEEMDLTPVPYIVIIVDEMADLMIQEGKNVEGPIQRLAQMARAAGIHLIMATQRPSVDVITGTIKANFPTRISFQLTTKIDSRTILGEQGAEQLLGQGDMLHMAGGGRISRVHGPFVSDEEVEKVVAHLKAQGRPDYLDAITAEDDEAGEEEGDGGAVFDKGAFGAEDGGDVYDQAVKVVLRDKKCSTSYIQRRLQIGYNRAASLVERMEKEGIVGPSNHAGKREILVYSRDVRNGEDGEADEEGEE
ncbi:S-DNA-T family DNA segregation ATPase FtsK/SpoIIIE [Labrys monachus]|uniref:DNA translocase FtsK n=2 Tax=Labrys monachus TaxID=217067 RepID=A0ABU0FQX6_9HYPH|nr:S-DNA-T family DNA segregation ATPase FtsK/SpoIIIE [Labrys monachus]